MSTMTLKDVGYTYKSKYQTVNALAGVSYEFRPGYFYAIVGRSGSGKTTMLSLMAGLDIPTSGSVAFGEKSTKNINRDKFRLEHVSVIYQSLNLFPLLTAIENVMFPLEYCGMSRSKAKKIAVEKLESVGIDKPKHRRLPSMLSGGEQQRVAIARALAAKSEVILADEPTGNLDSENSLNIVQLLKELAVSENVCVIVVTHDPAVAERADVVIKLSDGLIVEGPAVNERDLAEERNIEIVNYQSNIDSKKTEWNLNRKEMKTQHELTPGNANKHTSRAKNMKMLIDQNKKRAKQTSLE